MAANWLKGLLKMLNCTGNQFRSPCRDFLHVADLGNTFGVMA